MATKRDVAASTSRHQHIPDAGQSDGFADGTGEAGKGFYWGDVIVDTISPIRQQVVLNGLLAVRGLML